MIPSEITFEEAIAFTQSLMNQMEAGELPPAEISTTLAELVSSQNGARGFFVAYLTADQTLADNPSPEVVQALRLHPETVSELLVKNVAMSAAQALAHRRKGNQQLAQSSERVRDRTTQLIKLVDLESVYKCGQQLLESAATGEGTYRTFLERWGYDDQQRQTICQVLEQLMPT